MKTPNIEEPEINIENPLNDETLQYFRENLSKHSKIPYNRFGMSGDESNLEHLKGDNDTLDALKENIIKANEILNSTKKLSKE